MVDMSSDYAVSGEKEAAVGQSRCVCFWDRGRRLLLLFGHWMQNEKRMLSVSCVMLHTSY